MPVVVEVSPLEIARRARGLSQRDLARLACVCRETVSMIERGAVPRGRTALALARALDVGVDVLLPSKSETPNLTSGSRDNSVVDGDRYDSAA